MRARAAADAAPDPLFVPGFWRRWRLRLMLVAAYYVLAVPAGIARGYADDLGFPVRRDFNAVESALYWADPNRWLQAPLLDFTAVHYLASWLYASWFLLPLFATAPLVTHHARDAWRLVGFALLVYYAGMPFFYLYPLEPPWLQHPDIANVFHLAYPEVAGRDNNPYAAMPSLHIALPGAVALWYGWEHRWGRILWAYAALLSLIVVFTGAHYVADIAGGVALAAAVFALARWLRLPLLRPEQTALPPPSDEGEPRQPDSLAA